MKIQQYVNWIPPPPLTKKVQKISFDKSSFVNTFSHQLLSPGANRARGAERQRGKPNIFWSSSHQCHQSAQSITVRKNIQMQIHKKKASTKVQSAKVQKYSPYFPFLRLLQFIQVPIMDRGAILRDYEAGSKPASANCNLQLSGGTRLLGSSASSG